MIKDETKLVFDLSFNLTSWALPIAIGVKKRTLTILILCIGIEITRIKYKGR